LKRVLRWYVENIYGKFEGPGQLPFYCDPLRVGSFAVTRAELRREDTSGLFRLFIGLTMFQARRDVLIMRQQRGMSRDEVASLVSPDVLRRRAAAKGQCATLKSASSFDSECSVHKRANGTIDCEHRAGERCHVKDASVSFNRVGDMGKLPTSAWLHLFKDRDLAHILNEIVLSSQDPKTRATFLVKELSQVFRVGKKLATMYVSALATPALAPGLTPWSPRIDGDYLVVVDTNVTRGIAALRGSSGGAATYDAAANWIRVQSKRISLRDFHAELPTYSPRVVQQALYTFCSKSNRVSRNDPCSTRLTPCAQCVPMLCPFVARTPKA
jgi:hypothetical protein